MRRVSLSLPELLAEEVRRRAEARGVSVPRFLSELVEREVGGGWPEGYFERVVGAWKGEPLLRPVQGEHERR